MVIGKQILICTVVGVLFAAGQSSSDQRVANIIGKAQQVVCRDYTVSEVKSACFQAASGVEKATGRLKNAARYVEETMVSL
ncbi:hypothetical protein Ami103574_08635 [Aminipila butyrica]|uniref:Uncharacterized protein n=1 Tax=Aminipila butyrica TaxID=433296 RepID=A0A858BWB6_9FIRM|nr:hypothetical protein [Aminipila butyrica]QIB69388.1 hypothetical protein Ami103574_08635 [Aminipila butyrica]